MKLKDIDTSNLRLNITPDKLDNMSAYELFNSAMSWWHNDFFDEAYLALKKVVEKDPDYYHYGDEPYLHLGNYYHGILRDYKGAIELYNKCIENHPYYALAWEWRGYAYEALGEYQKLIEDFEYLLREKVNSLIPNEERLEEAIEMARKALKEE